MFVKKILLILSILILSVSGVCASFVDKSTKKIKASAGNAEVLSNKTISLNVAYDKASYSEINTNKIVEDQYTYIEEIPQKNIIQLIATESEIH